MSVRFAKLHGAGNDFILIDGFRCAIEDPAGLAKRLCQRRFGVGADGLILMLPDDTADARMRIFNSDGSEPEMCGNGIRCAARFMRDAGITARDDMRIATLAGIKAVELSKDGSMASVDMGCPEFEPERIPLAAKSNRIQLDVEGRAIHFFCVSMGNPHAVSFDFYPDEAELVRLGRMLEHHPCFPAGANIEFCCVESPSSVRVKVWERGAGATLACGTGSCAVLAAGATLGYLERSAQIHLPGGTLIDSWLMNNHIQMQGPVESVYTGEID